MTALVARRARSRSRSAARQRCVAGGLADGLLAPGGRVRSRSGLAGLWALGTRRHAGARRSRATSRRTPGSTGSPASSCSRSRSSRCPALVFASSYVAGTAAGRVTGVLSAAFVLALVGVLCARDALSFLFFWELMTLVPAAIILVGPRPRRPGRPSSRTSRSRTSAARAPGSRCCCSPTKARSATRPRSTEGSSVQAVIAIAAIVGFGTKAGLMPMHAWLPRAHPIAPAPSRR